MTFDPIDTTQIDVVNVPNDSPLKKLTDKGTYKGLIKVKNTDPNVEGEYKYMEISNWWKTHKNVLKRHADDMPPINYEKEHMDLNAWDWITTALTQEKSDEAKQFRREIKYVFNGNKPGRMCGY